MDAGYLFAQGSVALSGSKKPRANLALDAPAVISDLRGLLATHSPKCSLLRIYWYDGSTGGGRLTSDQALLARLDDVKVRLGYINSSGQQKGVDSLIVTDLIELSRQKAICDAILLSGDEDVRVGVQIAQNYGVRVHLLGIAPARASQSPQLLWEADTTTEWDQQTIRRFLSERPSPPSGTGTVQTHAPKQTSPTVSAPSVSFDPNLELAAKSFSDDLQPSDIEGLAAYWQGNRGLPSEIDRRLLPAGRLAIGRDLTADEKRFIRARVQNFARARIDHLVASSASLSIISKPKA